MVLLYDRNNVYENIFETIFATEQQAIVAKEQQRRGKEINYSYMDESEYQFRVKRRDPFILRVLIQPKIMLIGDESDLLSNIVV